MITTESLSRAIDEQRLALGISEGGVEPVPYAQIAAELGIHASAISRLKSGKMPGERVLAALIGWLENEDAAHCTECENGADEELLTTETLDSEDDPGDSPTVKAVFAVGNLSESQDTETQDAVARVRELLNEGAVGVSVMLDTHPDDVKVFAEAEVDEKTGELILPEGFSPRWRIRHTAIVDTPAFADARLTLDEDGTVSGMVVFEGVYTGDGRTYEVDSIDLEGSRTPSPILWDRHDGDHTGMTVGHLNQWERRDAEETSARTVLDDDAITASLKPLTLPANYFATRAPKAAEPIRITDRDEDGYRFITGLAAPKGVCLRQSKVCWTWPGDKDKAHKNFHTGTLLHLDDGSDIRVGALTMGGAHLDGALARQGVGAKDASNHRDNANRVFALVRVWESKFGLMLSGVIPPDVTDADVARALACSPSIEFWPDGGSRTLIGLHLVPTPALPVMASVGSAEHYLTDSPIELESELNEKSQVEAVEELETEGSDASLTEALVSMNAKLDELTSTVNAILALTPIDSVDIPD